MEVVAENVTMLTNFEAYDLLRDIQQGQNGQQKPGKNQPHLATITYSTLKYLEETVCTQQSGEVIARLVQALKPFNLTKAEQLQIINHRPSSAVEIQLLIEDSEERLTEEQLDELLAVVTEGLPAAKEREAEGVEEETSAVVS